MVYVDMLIDYGNPQGKWKYGESCHLLADTENELHEFAAKIGMKREWFQNEAHSMPHYDLTRSKRQLAVKSGAIELTRLQLSEMFKAYRKEKAVIN